MKTVYVHYTDGNYFLREEGWGEDAIQIPDEVWEQYLAHCEVERWWQSALGALDNVIFDRREALDREIERGLQDRYGERELKRGQNGEGGGVGGDGP